MSEPQVALGAEDYGALLGMLTSGDASTRVQAQSLSKKLTPDEQQAFFDYQQQAHAGKDPELSRPDNSIGGVPPELAVVSGLGLGRAIAGGTGLAGKAVAGAKEMVSQAEPILKYEASKAALMHIGLPAPVAIPIAMAISGYRGSGKGAAKATAVEAAPVAAEASSVAAPAAIRPNTAGTVSSAISPEEYAATFGHEMPANLRPGQPTAVAPVAPAASVAPPASAPAVQGPPSALAAPQSDLAPPSGSARVVMSPQRIQNELGLAARRAKVTLTEPQYQQATDLVAQGKTPMEAVTTIGGGAAPPVTAPATPAKLKLNKSELNEYVRLTRGGMTPAEAAQSIAQQRQLLEKLGTPSTEDVIRKVVDRNTTGRWEQ